MFYFLQIYKCYSILVWVFLIFFLNIDIIEAFRNYYKTRTFTLANDNLY